MEISRTTPARASGVVSFSSRRGSLGLSVRPRSKVNGKSSLINLRRLPLLSSPKSKALLASRIGRTWGCPCLRPPYFTSVSISSPVLTLFNAAVASFAVSTSDTTHSSLSRRAPGPNLDLDSSSNFRAVVLSWVRRCWSTFSNMPFPLLPPPKRRTNTSNGSLIAAAV
ncbi:MAG: hypothetical protein A4E48_00317 [Methanosaeta sp. PtaU1.Bin060]|nr:MAG: hypothetical protein A4E48_00317 [Methanosaeta sp. PtaU1.Bin060]